jgi:aminopeptidase N
MLGQTKGTRKLNISSPDDTVKARGGLLFLVLLGLGMVLPSGGQAQAAARETLPDTVIPVHYDLALVPNAEALTFRGQVTITVIAKTPVRDIVLNAQGLVLDHVTIDGNGRVTTTADPKLGRETFHRDQPITVGRHLITIAYHGKIGRSTLGFFAMDYVGPNGPRRTLATNFEPAAARQLLPCWDEPGVKASFTIIVDAPKDRMAISNMPVAQAAPISATMQRVRFAETPKMSTYLLFLGIGDFERVHKTVDGVDVGVVVKRGDTGRAGYALDQAGRILHYYNGYFGTPYPLPKLDLVAAPGQISGGSMENWGAIFYSQEHLLFDPKTSTEDDRQLVFLVVAHEMSHQWFGDLVTMAWWDNLWLNEGFARWMQTYAADDLHPEWKTGLRALAIFENGKQADAIPSTHPIVQPILTADQAGQAFDNITYDKGAAVITMINAYVGRYAFREGVRRYMHAHAFGNTVDRDLWAAIQEAAGKPILDIERDVTLQEGVPLIRVASKRAATILTESRFAADPSTIASAPRQSWLLPVAVRNLSQAKPQVKLLRAPTSFEISAPVLVNAGQTTYARVLYSRPAIDALVGRMGSLPSADQFGLLNDNLALGLAGYSPASNVLALAKAVPVDADPIVWQRVISVLSDLDGYFAPGPGRTAYRQFALTLLNPIASRLGFAAAATDDGNTQILRASLEEVRGKFGDPAVVAWAKRTLASQGGPAADKRTALRVVAGQADTVTFDGLLAQAKAEKDPLVKQHLFEALAEVQDPILARRMVEIAFGGDPPAGAGPYLLGSLAQNHPDLTWDGALPHIKDPKLALENTMRWRLAIFIASRSALPARIEAVEGFEQNVPVPARRPFSGAIASIRQNQHIRQKVIPELNRWIAAHGG